MKIIVAVGRDWGIGKDNKLLFSLKEDMSFFKATTIGKVVVMGKNTYTSLPKRPLKDRVNIVVTREDPHDGCIAVSSFDQLFSELKKYDTDDVYVIGGASMYRQMLPYCDSALVTKVDAVADADAFFEDLDAMPNWQCVSERKGVSDPITFCTYKNTAVRAFSSENN